METNQRSQARRSHGCERRDGIRSDLITPNPKLKLLGQVREVMRLKHYSIRTERSYCDWIRRYIHFHGMRSREDLNGAEAKIEQFLSDLAVNGHVSASTQNQAFNALPWKNTCSRLGTCHVTRAQIGVRTWVRTTYLQCRTIPGRMTRTAAGGPARAMTAALA